MRKVRYFFNIKPFIESLVSESVACVKDISIRIVEDLEYSGEKLHELKKRYLKTVDYHLAKPLVEKINNFGSWMENCGILEIPDEILKEYMHLISLSDEQVADNIDPKDEVDEPEEFGITLKREREAGSVDCLISDIIATIDQIKILEKEVNKLETIYEEKKTSLNTTLNGRRIAQIFGPLVEDLKTKYSSLLNENTIEKFRIVMNDFCIALEERNELRYKLVFGEDGPNLKDQNNENNNSSNALSEEYVQEVGSERSKDTEKVINTKGRDAKRHKSVVDQNAMKIFARWSLPINNSTKNPQK